MEGVLPGNIKVQKQVLRFAKDGKQAFDDKHALDDKRWLRLFSREIVYFRSVASRALSKSSLSSQF